MKIAGVARQVKNNGHCTLFRVGEAEEQELFIGTTTGIYPLAGFPRPQNEEELAMLLGIPENKWKSIMYEERRVESADDLDGLSMQNEPAPAGQEQLEWICELYRLSVLYHGITLIPLINATNQAVGFVDMGLLMPIADEIKKSEYITYHERRTKAGGRYYVIKDGMIARAALLPVDVGAGFSKELRFLTEQVWRNG